MCFGGENVKPYHAGMYRLILVMLVLQFAWGYSGSANWLGLSLIHI